jgi:cell division septum initiation protein DivIVA
MPDQHTAATEHALITKIAEPLDQLPDDPLADVSVDFPIALRGYDRFAVDAYVERTAQLVAELQSTRSPEAAVRRALERVGEEISGILQRAHDTADEITARSRSEAEERLEQARSEATEIAAAAEHRVRDLDAETERIWAERHSIVTDARELARRLTELAESALERFPADGPAPGDGPEDLTASVSSTAAPVPAYPFDGAVEAEPTPEPSAEDEPRVAQAIVDQPTEAMAPIEQWESDGGPAGSDGA